jgi:hypothetical protein
VNYFTEHPPSTSPHLGQEKPAVPRWASRLHREGGRLGGVCVVLKNVMDGKGKRLEINIRPVLAAEFQIILEGREVHAGLDVAVNINVKHVSRHRSVTIETYNRTRGSTAPLALDERDSPHARRSRRSSLGKTTLTAATGEYNEKSSDAGLAGVLGALLTASEARASAYDARTAYNSLPLSFEANQGQLDKRALPSSSNGDATGKHAGRRSENVRLGIRSCNPL